MHDTHTIEVNPVTRVEGHFKIKVEVEGGTVKGAYSTGALWRGFEKIMEGRDPRDAVYLSQRICGVCTASHAVASAQCLENAYGITPPQSAVLARNLMLGSNYLMSHIMHLYLLSGPDYAGIVPEMKAFDGTHYREAVKQRRRAHEMLSILGGKMPHLATIIAGGVTQTPSYDKIVKFKSVLSGIKGWLETTAMKDIERIEKEFPEGMEMGAGVKRFISYGAFPEEKGYLFESGTFEGQRGNLAPEKITEDLKHTWLNEGATPEPEKEGAYSWLAAPRYENKPYETGPLARAKIAGKPGGISLLDRNAARARESLLIAEKMAEWADMIDPAEHPHKGHEQKDGSGMGLTDAARGALGHWIRIEKSRTARYAVIAPTTWNASPRDSGGIRGPIEEALIGTPVNDIQNPENILRIVRSFDPCLACAAQITDLDRKKRVEIGIVS